MSNLKSDAMEQDSFGELDERMFTDPEGYTRESAVQAIHAEYPEQTEDWADAEYTIALARARQIAPEGHAAEGVRFLKSGFDQYIGSTYFWADHTTRASRELVAPLFGWIHAAGFSTYDEPIVARALQQLLSVNTGDEFALASDKLGRVIDAQERRLNRSPVHYAGHLAVPIE